MLSDRSNTQLLKDSYEAFGRGAFAPLFLLLSDDVEWVDLTIGPLAGTYCGKPAVPNFFAQMMHTYGGTLKVEVSTSPPAPSTASP